MNADKDYLSLPLRDLLTDIAAKSPTPGGGSVAAVVGGLSASLARMVLEYTVGKPQFAQHEGQLRELLAELTQAGEEFARLVSEDMRAYEAVVAARKLDQATRDRAAARATAVPLEILAQAEAVVTKLDAVKALVNPRLLGDLKAAAAFATAAAKAAACMGRDNLQGSQDRQDAARIEDRLTRSLGCVDRHCSALLAFNPA
jgi:formiminotetrahydrofolate cyclodeaminase